ncbi:hypothetical protein ACFVU2_05535 [Leifsonia sp. NPDC058194]|uniref:hypothetical protein n=1 Tax=Leifsonia sp. NPDC058194 TaxID=3346374 RepID=UPI0036D9CCBD
MRRTARTLARTLALSVVLGLGMLLAGAGAASADDGGIGISIDIPSTDDTSTGGTGSSGTGGSGYPGTTVPTDAPPSDVAGPGATPAPAVAVDNGPFNVSGLNAKFVPSLNPGAGSIVVSFSVHNGSASTWSSTVRVWLTGPFGNALDDSGAIAVTDLKPGHTVTYSRTLTGVGQWAVVTAHAKFTPPATIDGIATKPALREATVFAFPWLGSVGAVLAATALAIVLALRAAAAVPAAVLAVRA